RRSHFTTHTTLFLFFLHAHPAHRDLHSFPTRRSSDLREPVRVEARQQAMLQRPPPDPYAKRLVGGEALARRPVAHELDALEQSQDRKSTRLNSSHVSISYAVFCLKKKKTTKHKQKYTQ